MFLNSLSEKRDMKKLEPQVKQLHFNNGYSINITIFDFKQQLLSLFRDKELMKPENIIYGQNPPINKNCISEIQDSMWYKNAVGYFNKQYGSDNN